MTADIPEFEMSSAAAAEALLQVQASEDVTPLAAKFGHFLADRLTLHPTTRPSFLVVEAEMSLLDLMSGIDGRTHELLDNDLVGLPNDDYRELGFSVSALVRAALPPEFAAGVDTALAEIREAAERRDTITEPITTIEEAYEQIMDGAVQASLALDWSVLPEPMDEEAMVALLQATHIVTLRQSPFIAPINLMIDTPEQEADILAQLPDSNKAHLNDDDWLVFLAKEIDPQLATATRDLLFLKGLEAVAHYYGLDPVETQTQLLAQNPSMQRAVERFAEYMLSHPENFRQTDI